MYTFVYIFKKNREHYKKKKKTFTVGNVYDDRNDCHCESVLYKNVNRKSCILNKTMCREVRILH